MLNEYALNRWVSPCIRCSIGFWQKHFPLLTDEPGDWGEFSREAATFCSMYLLRRPNVNSCTRTQTKYWFIFAAQRRRRPRLLLLLVAVVSFTKAECPNRICMKRIFFFFIFHTITYLFLSLILWWMCRESAHTEPTNTIWFAISPVAAVTSRHVIPLWNIQRLRRSMCVCAEVSAQKWWEYARSWLSFPWKRIETISDIFFHFLVQCFGSALSMEYCTQNCVETSIFDFFFSIFQKKKKKKNGEDCPLWLGHSNARVCTADWIYAKRAELSSVDVVVVGELIACDPFRWGRVEKYGHEMRWRSSHGCQMPIANRRCSE